MSKTHLQKGHIQCTVLLCKKERVDQIFSFHEAICKDTKDILDKKV